MDPAKDLCNNPVHRCVNNPFINGGQVYNNLSLKKKKHKSKVPSQQFVPNPAKNKVLGYSGFDSYELTAEAVEGNFLTKFLTVHQNELESSLESGGVRHSNKVLQNKTADTSVMENDMVDDVIQDLPVKKYYLNSDNEENELSSSNFSNDGYTGNSDEDHEFGTNGVTSY